MSKNPFADWTMERAEEFNKRHARIAIRPGEEIKPVDPAILVQMSDAAMESVVAKSQLPPTSLIITPSTDEQKLNKLEKSWLKELRDMNFPWISIQGIGLKLADDTRYYCDFFALTNDGKLVGYETKGGFFRDDAKVKIKVAARMYPWIKFILVTREKGQWVQKEIKP